jgi:group I intron endonuclease
VRHEHFRKTVPYGLLPGLDKIRKFVLRRHMLTSGIYCIENKNNCKRYIGKSGTGIEKRWKIHKYELNKNIHKNKHLQYSWLKNGENNFLFYIIEKCENVESILNEREIFWINKFKANNPDFGYNLTIGGDGMSGYKHNLNAKNKLSVLFKGKPKSEEHKKKLSLSNLGKPKSEEQKIKQSNSTKGKSRLPLSENTKRKLSEINMGKKQSKETRKKISNSLKNRYKDIPYKRR